MGQLRELTRGDFGFEAREKTVEAVAGALHIADTDANLLLNACSTLYQLGQDQRNRSELVVELKEMSDELGWGVDFANREEPLSALFELNEDFDRDRKRRRTVERVMPVLDLMLMEVDFRLVTDEDDQPLGFVPVVLARFGFDEAISGQDAVWFQIPESVLDEMTSVVAGIRDQIETAKLDIGDKLY